MIEVVKVRGEEKVVIDKELAYLILVVEDIAGGLATYRIKGDPFTDRKMVLLESAMDMEALAKAGVLEKGVLEEIKRLAKKALDSDKEEDYDKLERVTTTAFLHAVSKLTPRLEDWFVDLEEYLEEEWLL